MTDLRFIVVSDSHIRFPDDEAVAYRSNARLVARNEYVVDLCNRIDAAFVVHLGDIVHPLPLDPGHEPAVRLAGGIYAKLRAPVYFVAGNHDIGDKPNALVAVPAVADANYRVFESHWGPAHRSFDVADGHFVIIDTPVINSGLEREVIQREWLHDDLAAARRAGRRIFLFTHYPPFGRAANEAEHYDNLGEPGRSWLLGEIEHHQVEAVFSGHVHNFLYNRHHDSDLYVLPATGFVRPDYSELAAVIPNSEGGRDDPPKLGLFVVDVSPDGHEIRPIRTYGHTDSSARLPIPLATLLAPGWESPIGVTLRHGWASTVDFPCAGLDELNRKTMRNDAMLPALWEARIRAVRVPATDLLLTDRAERLRHLTRRGMRISVFSGGVPAAGLRRAVAAVAEAVVRWDIAVPTDSFADLAAEMATCALPFAVAPIVPLGDDRSQHFVTSGFDPTDGPILAEWLRVAAGMGDLIFRVGPREDVAAVVAAAVETARAADRSAVVSVELPRGAEAIPFDDDAAVAARVVAAVRAARRFPDVAIYLDLFVDHDRGYYPRHGLTDRSYNPRPALHALAIESSRGE